MSSSDTPAMATSPQAVNLDFVNIPTGQLSGATAPTVQYNSSNGGQSPVAQQSAIDANFGLFSLLSPSFWLAAFALDTEEVTARLTAAVWPFRRPQLFLSLIGGKPDLYGPAWIAATLVMSMYMGSNIASYLNFTGSEAVPIWRSDFKKLVEAAFVAYSFSVGVPTLCWIASVYLATPAVGIVSLVCLYGYSLAVFVPAALLCILPSAALQWTAVLAATCVSTFFVLSNVARVTLDSGLPLTRAARGLLLLQLVAHVAFGVCLKLFFFTFSIAR